MIVPASIVRRPWEHRAAPWQRWATAVLLAAYVALLAVTLRDSLDPVTLGITATWTEAKRAEKS